MMVAEVGKMVLVTKRAVGFLGLCGLVLTLASCAALHNVSSSDMARGPGYRIWAKDTGHGFFMLSMPDLDATAKLKAQCAGTITGVQSTTWSRNWFLIVQHYHQEVVGWCLNN